MSVDWIEMHPDPSESQVQLRRGLGTEALLERRRCWHLKSELHVEIYEYAADAPNLIFLPGIGTYVELYAELLCALCDQGVNVIAIDPPGHGYSAGTRGDYRVEPFCDQISQVIDRVSERNKGSWSVYGYSIGALVAVALAERDSRVRQVFCGTFLVTEYPPDMMHMMGWSITSFSAFFMPTVRVPLKTFIDFEQLLGAHPAGALINQDPRIVFDYPMSTLANLFTHRSGVTERIYDFELTVVQGTRDEVIPIDYAREVCAKLVHPCHLVEIPAAGHMLPWDDPRGLAHILTSRLRA